MTALEPSMACTRAAARATRMLITVSPQSASCRPVSRTSWSGTSRNRTIPPTTGSPTTCPPSADPSGTPGRVVCQVSSCQRTRSATASPESRPSCRHRRMFSLPSAKATSTRSRTQARPRAASPACSSSASAFAANTTGSESPAGGSNSRLTDREASGGRGISGRGSRPRASRCACAPAAPNRLAASAAGSRAKSPSVQIPSRGRRLLSSGTSSTLTGYVARNAGVPPGGTIIPTGLGWDISGGAAWAASWAANRPSATPD